MVAWECPTKPREASGLDPEAVHSPATVFARFAVCRSTAPADWPPSRRPTARPPAPASVANASTASRGRNRLRRHRPRMPVRRIKPVNDRSVIDATSVRRPEQLCSWFEVDSEGICAESPRE
ncbi:hypothetical protein CV102_19480 [Natronococcus pandeyae]|uniref:Uncharacterized protein n=1 Tax=Natronococcus pandeyae TaxID=2055836 RepID=A0A8J8TQQ4_9EURY|nr:hypothetical protein CV102_19480 [Natronococcus pandeyae]